MKTVSCKLPQDVYDRLNKLSEESDRKVSYLMREAIIHYMGEYEKYLIAANILAKEGKQLSIDEIKEQFESSYKNK